MGRPDGGEEKLGAEHLLWAGKDTEARSQEGVWEDASSRTGEEAGTTLERVGSSSRSTGEVELSQAPPETQRHPTDRYTKTHRRRIHL